LHEPRRKGPAAPNRATDPGSWQSTVGMGGVLLGGSLIPLWSLSMRWQGHFSTETLWDVAILSLLACGGLFCIIAGILKRRVSKTLSPERREELRQERSAAVRASYPRRKTIIAVILLGLLLFWLLLRAEVGSRESRAPRLPTADEVLEWKPPPEASNEAE